MRELSNCEIAAVAGGTDAFECIVGVTPVGVGGGVCTDTNGGIYIEGAVGTPGLSYSAGVSNSSADYLTGASVSCSVPGATAGVAVSGDVGVGYSYGSPGCTVTYGVEAGDVADWFGDFFGGFFGGGSGR